MLAYALAMNAARLEDAERLQQMVVLCRIGLSVFVFGCILSLGTGMQYFLAATQSKPERPLFSPAREGEYTVIASIYVASLNLM